MKSIQIKSWKALKGLLLVAFHPKMIALAVWVSVRYSEVVFTSGYREKKIHDNDSGIACTDPCRHLDIRSWVYENPINVVEDINKNWQYDHTRPEMQCAILHDTGQGVHIHLQTNDNTLYLGG
jgi:hypothetical protein